MSHFPRAVFALCFGALAAMAHPMGNFSVNHYARISVAQPASEILFVLDLAELPSFELMQKWGVTAAGAPQELQKLAAAEARGWARQLSFTANGKRVIPVFEGAELAMTDGAGGLPVLRVASRLRLPVRAGTLLYRDGTYPDRTAGWKEVVVVAGPGAELVKSSVGAVEKSAALTAYPQDPTLAPLQDLEATVEWRSITGSEPVSVSGAVPPREKTVVEHAAPVIAPAVQETPAPAKATAATVREPNARGQVRRGDFLSKALQGKEISWGLGLLMVAVAFWFGALHALEPGHGKTMVAAYLVGERGTPQHAMLLGGMVTFTHTISVFVLGLLTMFLSQYIMPDVISKWLGVISGLTIVWIGGLMTVRRMQKLREPIDWVKEVGRAHSHGGGPMHTHSFADWQQHEVQDPANHAAAAFETERGVSIKSLIALGASGGLVPCPSALVLLLAAVSVGRIGFGLLLLVSFSLGLALVLMATGLLVLYAKRFVPRPEGASRNPVFRFLPVLSAALICVIGLVLTGNALGWLPAVRFFG